MEIEISLKGLSREGRKSCSQSMYIKELLKASCWKRREKKRSMF